MKITIKKSMVDEIIDAAEDVWTWIDNLYRHTFKVAGLDYDALDEVGRVSISEEGNHYITSKAIDFDKRVHPDVLPGGAWALGPGFSTDHSLRSFKNGGWEVTLPTDG